MRPWGSIFNILFDREGGADKEEPFSFLKKISGLHIFLMLSGCKVTRATLGSYLSLESTHDISRYNDEVNSMFN